MSARETRRRGLRRHLAGLATHDSCRDLIPLAARAVLVPSVATVTLVFQLLDPVFARLGVGAWFALGIAWFALVGRHRLVLAPEEAFASRAAGRAGG